MNSKNTRTTGFVQVLLLLGGMVFGTVVQAISSGEREALISLYEDTDGPGWTANNNWDITAASGSECSWDGVFCENIGGVETVTRLDLYNSGLNGSLPANINQLTGLKILNMGANRTYNDVTGELIRSLSGPIPTELGDITTLQEVILNLNQLNGSIPPSLGSLSNLLRLELANNKLSGTIPTSLGSLKDLTTLTLSSNHLEGNIPETFGQLTKLRTLSLAANKLTGEIPGTLSGLVSRPDFVVITLDYNAVYSSDETLVRAINEKHQPGNDFTSTQTLDPDGVGTALVSSDQADINWISVTPIVTDTIPEGGYRVYLSTQPDTGFDFPHPVGGDKSADSTTVSGLKDCTVYYVQVRTYTSPHSNNGNEVESDGETIEFVTPGSGPSGCPPVITGGTGSYTVAENVAVGTHVTTITARDSDDDDLTYQIIGGDGTFDIHPSNGEITLGRALDVTSTTIYSLAVEVKDSKDNRDTGSVIVNATNVNSGTPDSGNGGGGGCSIRPGAAFDPLLPFMLLLALAYLANRARMAPGSRR